MKKWFSLLLLATMLAGILSCEKEGPRGPKGASGADGKDGNANVRTFLFTDSMKLAWVGANINFMYDSLFSIPDSICDEGMVLVYMQYYTYGSWWYTAPGLGYSNLLMTRVYYNEAFLNIDARNPDGSSWSGGTLEPVSKIRIVLVPPSEVTLLARSGQIPDLSDYHTSMDYFNIKD